MEDKLSGNPSIHSTRVGHRKPKDSTFYKKLSSQSHSKVNKTNCQIILFLFIEVNHANAMNNILKALSKDSNKIRHGIITHTSSCQLPSKFISP